MTAALPDGFKSVLCEDSGNLTARQDVNLPNRYLQPRNEYLILKPMLDLLGGSCLKKKLNGIFKIEAGFLDSLALTGNINFRTKSDV